jgi:hypothetical protein
MNIGDNSRPRKVQTRNYMINAKEKNSLKAGEKKTASACALARTRNNET